MEDKKPIDGAEYISLKDAKQMKLPFFEGLAAGFPSPAIDYQHESLDLNEKFVHHPEASYFVRVRGESMIGLGILDGDICLADRQEEIYDGTALHPEQGHRPLEAVRVGQGTDPQSGGLQTRLPISPALHPAIQERGRYDTE